MKLTLNLELDDRHWYVLGEIAERRGLRVDELLAEELREGLGRLTPGWHPVPREPSTKRQAYRRPGDGRNPYWKSRPFPEADPRRDIVLREFEAGRSISEIARLLYGRPNYRDRIGATIWDLGYDTGLPAWEQARFRAKGSAA